MQAVVQPGAIGFGTVGHLKNAITFLHLQLVIDNEIARYVRRCVRGIEVNDETLALDLLEETGINGNNINSVHTAEKQDFYKFLFALVLWAVKLPVRIYFD